MMAYETIINYVVIIFASVVGAITTFELSVKNKWGPVKASSVLCLVIALFFYLFPNIFPDKFIYLCLWIPAAFMGGSFAGMSSSKRIKSMPMIVVSGLIFAVVFLNSPRFDGFGGKLGISACASIIITISIFQIVDKVKEWHIRNTKKIIS